MKILIEFLPIFVLFGLYKVFGIKLATAGFMLSLVLILFWKYYQTKKWDKLLLITSTIGLVLGGATLFLDNPIYLQHKPTVVYGIMSAFFWVSYKFFNKNWIEILYSQVVTIRKETAKTLLYGTVWFFIIMLIINVILVKTVDFDLWITIKTWGFLVATILFAMWQGMIIYKDQSIISNE